MRLLIEAETDDGNPGGHKQVFLSWLTQLEGTACTDLSSRNLTTENIAEVQKFNKEEKDGWSRPRREI